MQHDSVNLLQGSHVFSWVLVGQEQIGNFA
jgi:hypothetical protein